MKKLALQEVAIDTWLTLHPIKPIADLPSTFRLPADKAYIDHGGKVRIKFQPTPAYSDFCDAVYEEGHSALVKYELMDVGGKRYKGDGNIVTFQDEVILKDFPKTDMNKIMKSAIIKELEVRLEKSAAHFSHGEHVTVDWDTLMAAEHGAMKNFYHVLQNMVGSGVGKVEEVKGGDVLLYFPQAKAGGDFPAQYLLKH